jgi:cell division protein ZapA (FtsZ GTPase activity inhibitor)
MGTLSTLLARLKLSTTDAAIIAVVVVAALNVLAEFWAWLGSPP